MLEIDQSIQDAANSLRHADALLITAGAGMGVDSGLPDFRGDHGFWRAYPPIAKLGISFVQMANPEWFHRDPHLAWAFYGHRLYLYRKTVPHAGFTKLLNVGIRKPNGCFVFTSNVDGQFQKAGFDQRYIEECHGSIHHLQCVRPCNERIWSGDNLDVEIDERHFKAMDPLPKCPDCKNIARPNILMFGDWSWLSSRTDSQRDNFYEWLRQSTSNRKKLVIIECGAGEAVATVRYMSENIAARTGGILIRINPRDTHVPAGHISIPLGAAEGIEAITKDML